MLLLFHSKGLKEIHFYLFFGSFRWLLWPYLCGCQEIKAVKRVNDKSLNKKDELVELPRQAEREGRHVHQPHHHLLGAETQREAREELVKLTTLMSRVGNDFNVTIMASGKKN